MQDWPAWLKPPTEMARAARSQSPSGGDGGRQLVGHEVQREVERAYGADDADGYAEGERQLSLAHAARLDRHDIAREAAGLDGGEREGADGPLRFDARRLDGLGRL